MTRNDDQETPRILDPERENGSEEEKEAASAKVVKQDESLTSLAIPAQLVPEEGQYQAAPRRQPVEREESSAPPAEKRAEVHQLLLDAVHQNANRLNRRLRTELTGRVQLLMRGSGEAYLLDWREEELRIEQRRDPEAECSIEVGAADLMEIARGELNPQIAMLSDKMRVSGESRMAIYVFNLFATK